MRWKFLGLVLCGTSLICQVVLGALPDVLATIWDDHDHKPTLALAGVYILVFGILGMLPDRRSRSDRRRMQAPKLNVRWELFCFELLAGLFVVLVGAGAVLSWIRSDNAAFLQAGLEGELARRLQELFIKSWRIGLILIHGLVTVILAIWGMLHYKRLYQMFLKTGDWNLGTHISDH